MKKCKSALALGSVLLLFLIGISGCFEKPKYYPHYLTAFVEPDTFQLVDIRLESPWYQTTVCTLILSNKNQKKVSHFGYDGSDPKIKSFLTLIGDTHYPSRGREGRLGNRKTGVITSPKSITVTCDHDYNETLKARMLLNEVAFISFSDYLGFIQSGYKNDNYRAQINLGNQENLKRLLASKPLWRLQLNTIPEAWNGETVRFTVTMVLPTDKGDKSVTNSIDVKFPIQSQTPMQ